MIRVGLCGFGGLGHLHANNLARIDGIQLAAVCDIRPGQLAAPEVITNLGSGPAGPRFDIRTCRTYTDYRTMLKKESLDAVVSALPTDLHTEFAIRAMQAGCHVFSEKPMALTVRDCDRMIAARDRYQRQLMIGQCLRFWPAYEALAAAVREGTYGRLQTLWMERVGGYAGWGAFEDWFNDARRSGGAILDLHLHDVDWAVHALGLPQFIYAAGRTGKTGGIDDVTAVWEYTDGPVVTMRGSWMYVGFSMGFRALFEKAALDFGGPDYALRLRRPGQKEAAVLPLDTEEGHLRELRYFCDCVAGRQTNTVCTAESTRTSVRMVMAEHQSIARGRRLAVRQEA